MFLGMLNNEYQFYLFDLISALKRGHISETTLSLHTSKS